MIAEVAPEQKAEAAGDGKSDGECLFESIAEILHPFAHDTQPGQIQPDRENYQRLECKVSRYVHLDTAASSQLRVTHEPQSQHEGGRTNRNKVHGNGSEQQSLAEVERPGRKQGPGSEELEFQLPPCSLCRVQKGCFEIDECRNEIDENKEIEEESFITQE